VAGAEHRRKYRAHAVTPINPSDAQLHFRLPYYFFFFALPFNVFSSLRVCDGAGNVKWGMGNGVDYPRKFLTFWQGYKFTSTAGYKRQHHRRQEEHYSTW